MRLLLDTQVFLWMNTSPQRLKATRGAIDDLSNELLLSAASSWEIAIKHALGKLDLPEPPEIYVPSRMRSNGVEGLAVQHGHALRVASLPPHHRDPFDRLLAVQAQMENLLLVTADPVFELYLDRVLRPE
jgi:PIN domain nuclease of toxin-antitoxin system